MPGLYNLAATGGEKASQGNASQGNAGMAVGGQARS